MASRFVPNPAFEPLLLRSTVLRQHLSELGDRTVEAIVPHARRRLGILQDSIKHAPTTGDQGKLVERVFSDDFKAPWHEFGTSKKEAQPFMAPGAVDVFGAIE